MKVKLSPTSAATGHRIEPATPQPRRCPRRYRGAISLLLLLLATAGFLTHRLQHRAEGLPPAAPSGAAAMDPAERQLRGAVARQPRSPAAHASLGTYFLDQGRPASALWEFETARALGTADGVQTTQAAAQALLRMGQRDLAIASLRMLLVAPPDPATRSPSVGRPRAADSNTRRELSEALLAVGRPTAALDALSARSTQADPEACLLMARADQALGRLREAEAGFRRYARIAPVDTPRFEPLGRFLLAAGRVAEAREVLMQDQRVSFQRADYHYWLGLTYLRARPQPDLHKALGAFLVALQLNPRHPQAHAALGELYERQGARERAGAEYQAAIEADPSQPEPHVRLASLLMGLGQPELAWEQQGIAAMLEDRQSDAVSAYRRMLATAPGDLAAARALILACIARKQIGLTQPAVAALERRPLNPAEAGLVGNLFLMTNAREPCRQLAAAWARLQPDSPGSLRLRARLALDDLQGEEAIRLYQAAWTLDQRDADTAAALGHALARVPSRAHLEQARDWYRRAISLEPANANYHVDLARIVMQLGQPAPARDEFLQALDLDPSLSSAAGGLAEVAHALNQPVLAQRFGQIARALDDRDLAADLAHHRVWDHPGDAGAHLSLARMMVDAGALEMARVHLQQALALRPAWKPALDLLQTVQALLVWS